MTSCNWWKNLRKVTSCCPKRIGWSVAPRITKVTSKPDWNLLEKGLALVDDEKERAYALKTGQML